jgi:hypothetical protein
MLHAGRRNWRLLFWVPNMFDSLGVEVPCLAWWR